MGGSSHPCSAWGAASGSSAAAQSSPVVAPGCSRAAEHFLVAQSFPSSLRKRQIGAELGTFQAQHTKDSVALGSGGC